MPEDFSSQAASLNATLQKLHQYQQEKVASILKTVRWVAFLCCVGAMGLGYLWHSNASWIALIFAIILAIMGLGIFITAFIVADKLSSMNALASTALHAFDQVNRAETSGTVIDAEVFEENKQPTSSAPILENSETKKPSEF